VDLDPRTTAVIAVHMQRDIVTPEGAFGAFFAEQVAARDVIGVTRTVLDAAREAGSTVFYTRVAWESGYGDLDANSPLLGMVAQTGCLVDGTEMAEIVPELTPVDGDVVVTHKRVGGFTGSDLDAQLRQRGITTVLFAGVATTASVEGTARGASDLGYRTIIVADACSAATPEAHDASIASLGLLGEIATSEEVVQALKNSAPA
jgi:nicotinamidase-related amidase